MVEDSRPKVRERAATLIKTALEALNEAGGSLPLREVLSQVERRIALTPFDLEVYKKSGYQRWKSLIHFFSIDCAKAGFLRKQSGVWSLTPEGRDLLGLPAEDILNRATAGYRTWKAAQAAS